MDTSQIAAVTAIAALLTGLATLLTLRELQVQRRVQHRPELIVDDLAFFALRRPSDKPIPEVILVPRDSLLVNETDSTLRVRIRNVGRGVARDVRASWSFDAHAFAEILAPYKESIGGLVWIDGTITEFEGDEESRWFSSGSSSSRVGAILPVPTDQEASIGLHFPYAMMASAFFAAGSSIENMDLLSDSALPELTLRLSYRDVEGTKYTKALRFRHQPVVDTSWTLRDNERFAEIAQGYFLVDDA